MVCVVCQTTLDETAHFCHQCGHPVHEKSYCPNCGFRLENNFRFCPYCGVALSDSKFQDSIQDKLIRLENRYQSEQNNFQLALELAVLKIYLGDFENAQVNFEYILRNCQESELLFETYSRYGRLLAERDDIASLQKSVQLFTLAIRNNPTRPEVARMKTAIKSVRDQLRVLENSSPS